MHGTTISTLYSGVKTGHASLVQAMKTANLYSLFFAEMKKCKKITYHIKGKGPQMLEKFAFWQTREWKG